MFRRLTSVIQDLQIISMVGKMVNSGKISSETADALLKAYGV